MAAAALAGGGVAGAAGLSSAANSIVGALIGIGDSRKDSQGNTEFYGAILQALASSTSANLLSMPSILTLDNEKASILVGQNVPFVTGSYTLPAMTLLILSRLLIAKTSVSISMSSRISAKTVRLEVSQEVSSVVQEALAIPVESSLIKT